MTKVEMEKIFSGYKNKKVLVIGGTGFIGSNLVPVLKKAKAKITVANKRKETIFKDCQNLMVDITNKKKIISLIKEKFEIIFNLAGFSGQVNSQKNPIESFKVNCLGSLNLLEAVKKFSPQSKIVFSSSRLEYGKAQYLPVDENHPRSPTSFYGLDKLTVSNYALYFFKTYGIKVTILRSSNPYGPHPCSKFSGYSLINHFIDQALKDKELIIFGKGKQIRDYFYIDDLVRAFLLVGITKKADGQIYNLGFGKGIKLAQAAKKIVKIGGGRIVHRRWPKDFLKVETGDYVSDISKAKRELGWQPKVSFDEGIKLTAKKQKL